MYLFKERRLVEGLVDRLAELIVSRPLSPHHLLLFPLLRASRTLLAGAEVLARCTSNPHFFPIHFWWEWVEGGNMSLGLCRKWWKCHFSPADQLTGESHGSMQIESDKIRHPSTYTAPTNSNPSPLPGRNPAIKVCKCALIVLRWPLSQLTSAAHLWFQVLLSSQVLHPCSFVVFVIANSPALFCFISSVLSNSSCISQFYLPFGLMSA